jgi:DNA repair ATPase RecN
MKQLLVLLLFTTMSFRSNAQSEELQQLILNIEKLMQFKKILQNMYDGYKLISNGYNAVKDITEGNFKLHKVFLDGLSEVSPVVKRYKRIADIVDYQLRIVKDSKAAINRLKSDDQFSVEEIRYLSQVYSGLIKETVNCVEELSLVITSGQLRMSDEERLKAIDRLFAKVESQYAFVRDFTNSSLLLSMQRTTEQHQTERMRKLYHLK